jgi:predicted nucleotidyltransferase
MFDENAFDKGVDKSDQSVDVISKYKKQIEELNRQSAKQIEELNRQIILMKVEKYLNENKTFLENHIPIMEKYNDIYQQCIKPKQQKKTKTVRITKEKYNKLSVLFN